MGFRGKGRWTVVAALALAAGLIAASPAAAENRFAHPAGSAAPFPCTESGPTPADVCDIVTALAFTEPGEDLTLLGTGSYPNLTTNLNIPEDATVHGTAGNPVTLPFTAAVNTAIFFDPGSTLRDVTVNHAGAGEGVLLDTDGTLERVAVHRTTTSAGGAPCVVLGSGVLLRNSVCWNRGNLEPAVQVFLSNGDVFNEVTLRNVTAVAAGTDGFGIGASAFTDNTVLTVYATNVIASGTFDVVAGADGLGSSTTVALDHSNYFETSEGNQSTITPPSTAGNVATPPVFANAAGGNFDQLPTSTGTIDRGTAASVNGFGLGSLALSGEPRCLGAAPDIGADEFAGNPCSVPTALTPVPLGETGERAAALKRCKKKAKKKDWSKKRLKRCRKKAQQLPE